MEKKLVLFDSIIIRVKQSCLSGGAICAIIAMHLDLLHGPSWLKDSISLAAIVYMAFSRPMAYKGESNATPTQ